MKGEPTLIGKWRAEAIREGRAEAARSMLLRIGKQRLGEPSQEVEQHLISLTSAEEFEALADRLLKVNTWQEMLT